MNDERKSYLRYLALCSMTFPSDSDNYKLAVGMLELLDYTEELFDTLLTTTEACCEALNSLEQNVSLEGTIPTNANRFVFSPRYSHVLTA